MNPLGYDFYGEPTMKEIEDRRYELERQAEADAKSAERDKTKQEKDAAKAEAERLSGEQMKSEDRSKARREQNASARQAYLRGLQENMRALQEKSSRTDKKMAQDARSKGIVKARSELAKLLKVEDLGSLRKGIGLNNRVKNLLVSSKFDDGVIETILNTGLYSQQDIDEVRAEYDRGAKGR